MVEKNEKIYKIFMNLPFQIVRHSSCSIIQSKNSNGMDNAVASMDFGNNGELIQN